MNEPNNLLNFKCVFQIKIRLTLKLIFLQDHDDFFILILNWVITQNVHFERKYLG